MANVTIDVNARVDGLQRQLANVTQDLNRFSQNASFAGGVLKGAFAELASAATIAGFGALIKGAIDAGDNLRDLSKTTGLAVEQLAGLKLAASQSGADLDSTANAINKLSQNIGKNGEKFRQLGIDAKDPLEAFKQLADIFVSIEDPQTRAALAAGALGKSWQEVAPLLSEGGKALGEMVDKGTKASNMTAEFAGKADELNDSMAALNAKFQGIVVTLTGPILDGFLQLSHYISDINESAKEGQKAFDLFKFGIDGAVKVTAAAIDIFHRAKLGVSALLDKVYALASLDFNKFLKIDQGFSDDIERASASYAKLVGSVESSPINSEALRRGSKAIDSANEFAKARETRNELQHQLDIRKAINSNFKVTVGITGEELDVLKKQAAARAFIDSGKGGGGGKSPSPKKPRPRATSRKTTIDEGLRVIEQLRREKALLEDSSRVAAAKYDTQFGSLSKISPLQKEQIIALNKELETNDKLKDKLKEVSDLKAGISEIATDPNIDLSSFNRGLEQLRVKLKDGIIDEKTFTELSGNLSKSFNENFVGEAKESLDELSEFGKEAARNMQDSFAEFLYDPFKDGVKGMLDSFLDFLRRAAAEAASQKLLEAATGAAGKFDWAGLAGSIAGSFAGGIGSSISSAATTAAKESVSQLSQAAVSSGTKSFFANFSQFATGGDFAGGLRIVGEKGPELEATGSARIFSADQTRRILNSTNNQTTSNNNITINVSSDNGRIEARSLAQIQSAIGKSVNRASSRNG